MKKALFFLFLVPLQFLIAQETAPTLSLGLDKVLFQKGALDVDLIATMIADKQEELKNRIVEQAILEPIFDSSSFVTKNYVFSIVKTLMNEKNKNVLKKELMEHTSNYALVYVLAEMYLQLTWDKLAVKVPNEDYINYLFEDNEAYKKVLAHSKLRLDTLSIVRFNEREFSRFKMTLTDSLSFYFLYKEQKQKVKFNNLLLDMVFHAIRNNPTFIEKGFCNKPLYFNTDEYRLTSKFQTLLHPELKLKMYEDVRDFIGEIARFYENFDDILEILKSPEVKNKIDLPEFIKTKYLERINNYDATEFVKKDSLNSMVVKLEPYLNNQIDELNSILSGNKLIITRELLKDSNLLKNLGIIEDTLISKSVKTNFLATLKSAREILKFEIAQTNNNSDSEKIKRKLEVYQLTGLKPDSLIKDCLNLLQTNIQNASKIIKSDSVNRANQNFCKLRDSIFKELFDTYYFLKFNSYGEVSQRLNDQIKFKIIPSLASINLQMDDELKELIKELEKLTAILDLTIHLDFLNAFDGLSHQFNCLLKDEAGLSNIYLEFFSRLDKLDETETYYYLLKNLLMAGDQLQNRDAANALNIILHSIEKYTAMDAENDRIDLDVENIILALYNRYAERDKNICHFYLTVGLNNAFAVNSHQLLDGTGKELNSFSFASEKIGVRFNLFNWKLRQSYLNGETRPHSLRDRKFKPKANYRPEPIVSNIHALVYASGLLYQLTDLSTAKNLNTTFLGTGLGITFYNNLSFNASMLFPVKQDEAFNLKYPMLNLGFDIYFSEYLTALNKKRKQKKEVKEKEEVLGKIVPATP